MFRLSTQVTFSANLENSKEDEENSRAYVLARAKKYGLETRHRRRRREQSCLRCCSQFVAFAGNYPSESGSRRNEVRYSRVSSRIPLYWSMPMTVRNAREPALATSVVMPAASAKSATTGHIHFSSLPLPRLWNRALATRC